MTYVEQGRQQEKSLQQEQFDWLRAQSAEITEQTRLLRRIAKHTRLQYVLTWISLGVVAVIGLGLLDSALSGWARAHVFVPAVIIGGFALAAILASLTWPSDRSPGADT